MKKKFINLLVIILILVGYGFYKQFSFNEPSVLFTSQLNKVGVTEEFELSVEKKNYVIGLAINDKKISWRKGVDGNYTIEYYIDNKLNRKEIINKNTITKYYQGLWHISGSSSFSSWKQLVLGQLKQPGNYKIKITVHKPEDNLKNFTGKLYFFADKSNEKLMKEFNNYYTPEMKAQNKREKLLKNLIDANETNPNLISLRKALDENNFKKVKEIIELDNNITVNTDMIFKRRPLFYASFHNNTEIAKYLISQGADIHHKDELGKNALAYAIENNATKTAKLLIDNGVDVNEVVFVQNYLQYRIKGKHYPKNRVMSALQYTAGNALYEMTELLLKNGMKDNIIDWIATNVNIYNYLNSRTTMSKKEKDTMFKLFEKYNFKIEQIKQEKLFK